MHVTAINAQGETEVLERRCSPSPVGDSFEGLVSFDVTFLVRIVIVGRYTFDLEEDKSKPGLHDLPRSVSIS
jgi:hypothetical protein